MRDAAGAHYSTATDLADYLVRQGLPFREAHEVVGRVVRHGIARGAELGELSLDELRQLLAADRARRPRRAHRGGLARARARWSAAPRRTRCARQLDAAPALLAGRAARVRAGARGARCCSCWPARLAAGRAAARRDRRWRPSCRAARAPPRPAPPRWTSRASWWAGPTPSTRVDGTRLRDLALIQAVPAGGGRRRRAQVRDALARPRRRLRRDRRRSSPTRPRPPTRRRAAPVTGWIGGRCAFGRRYVYVVDRRWTPPGGRSAPLRAASWCPIWPRRSRRGRSAAAPGDRERAA